MTSQTYKAHPMLPGIAVAWPPSPVNEAWARWHWQHHGPKAPLQTAWEDLDVDLQVWILAELIYLTHVDIDTTQTERGCTPCARSRCASLKIETTDRQRSWRCQLPADGHDTHISDSGHRRWSDRHG